MRLPGTQAFITTHKFKWPNDWPLKITLAYPGKYSVTVQTQRTTGAPGAPNTYRRRIHRVEAGETLNSIARRYETSASELCALNNISNPDNIRVGQSLRLPPRNTSTGAAPPSGGGTPPNQQQGGNRPPQGQGGGNNRPPTPQGSTGNQNTNTQMQIPPWVLNPHILVQQQNSQNNGSPVAVAVDRGTWNIRVTAPDNRDNAATARLYDENNNIVYEFQVLLKGSSRNRSNRLTRAADTPLGEYSIPNRDKWLSGRRAEFGQNPRLIVNPISGEAYQSRRTLIRIHGGRQENWVSARRVRNNDGTERIIPAHWEAHSTPRLRATEGCLRTFDNNMIELKRHIDRIERRGIRSGKLIITSIRGSIEEQSPSPQQRRR